MKIVISIEVDSEYEAREVLRKLYFKAPDLLAAQGYIAPSSSEPASPPAGSKEKDGPAPAEINQAPGKSTQESAAPNSDESKAEELVRQKEEWKRWLNPSPPALMFRLEGDGECYE